MTPFTDDDLKRLKDRVNDPNGADGLHDIFAVDILHLLARLEAAEVVIQRALQYKHPLHGNCRCNNCKPVEIWRKAAGK